MRREEENKILEGKDKMRAKENIRLKKGKNEGQKDVSRAIMLRVVKMEAYVKKENGSRQEIR